MTLIHANESRRETPLTERVVKVHAARLDRPHAVVSRLAGVLSADETARADRFRFDRDRSRFVVGRGCLRLLLAGYLGRRPESLRFSYEDHGKPELMPSSRLRFNVAHSAGLAVYAFCLDAEVGVDVEPLQNEPDERIPEHFFASGEVAALRSLPTAEQARAFLRGWTRKEAFLKARGDGLTLALDSFDVTLEPGKPPAVLRTAWDGAEAATWSLHDLSSSFPGYVAALAIRGNDWGVEVEPPHDDREGPC